VRTIDRAGILGDGYAVFALALHVQEGLGAGEIAEPTRRQVPPSVLGPIRNRTSLEVIPV
jgi:hypothetical protein